MKTAIFCMQCERSQCLAWGNLAYHVVTDTSVPPRCTLHPRNFGKSKVTFIGI